MLQGEGWPARSWQQDGLLVEDTGGRRLRGGGGGGDGRTMTCRASVIVAGMWSARGRGAALGRRCRRPAAAAAARVRMLGSCRLARAPAALRRCRSRARPRPLLGPARGRVDYLASGGRPCEAPSRRRRWYLAADRAPPMLGLPCTRIFEKFGKNSKAGAIQEIFFKMAGAAKKKSGFPRKTIWDRTPELGLSSPLI